jgi:hypothetical protein
LAGAGVYRWLGCLTPLPVAASRRSCANNGMNVPRTTIPALLASNGTGTNRGAGRAGDSGQGAARGGPSDKRDDSAPRKAGYGVCVRHCFSAQRVPGKRCHAHGEAVRVAAKLPRATRSQPLARQAPDAPPVPLEARGNEQAPTRKARGLYVGAAGRLAADSLGQLLDDGKRYGNRKGQSKASL